MNITQEVYFLERMTNISTNDFSTMNRLLIWEVALVAFYEKPILGYGQENFYVVFNKYFNPEIYSHAGSRIWFDRSPNIFLDHLITGGIIGSPGGGDIITIDIFLSIFIFSTFGLI